MAEIKVTSYKGTAPGDVLESAGAQLSSVGANIQQADNALINNVTNKNAYVDLYFNGTWAAAPASGGAVVVYLVPKYETSTGVWTSMSILSPNVPEQYCVGSFICLGTLTNQLHMLRDIPLGPGQYEVWLKNWTNQHINSWTLNARFHNREVV